MITKVGTMVEIQTYSYTYAYGMIDRTDRARRYLGLPTAGGTIEQKSYDMLEKEARAGTDWTYSTGTGA